MADERFDPRKYISKMKSSGSDYLEVKWRLVWLREDHPDAVIETEMLHYTPDETAMFKAVVSLANGAKATGHKQESIKDFRDFAEKAETGAIGRALASLGYGTQFAPELDEGDRIVDSPVERRNAPQSPPEARQPSQLVRMAQESGARMTESYEYDEPMITFTPSGDEIFYVEKTSRGGRRYFQATNMRCEEHDEPWFSYNERDWSHGRGADKHVLV